MAAFLLPPVQTHASTLHISIISAVVGFIAGFNRFNSMQFIQWFDVGPVPVH